MNLYNGKLYFKCDRCGKDFKAAKYLYRVNFDQLDVENFSPFGMYGSQMCRNCWDETRKFIYGNEEETEEVSEKPEDDWDLYLKLKRSGELAGVLSLVRERLKEEVSK